MFQPVSSLLQDVHLKWTDTVIPILIAFVISRIKKYHDGFKMVSGLPGGFLVPFQDMEFPGILWNGFSRGSGLTMHWRLKDKLYSRTKSEVVTFVPYLLGRPEIYTNNIEIMHQVAIGGHQTSFGKPQGAAMKSLTKWGMNILAAENELWRKHRRVVGPAFNVKLLTSVMAKTAQVYDEMVTGEGWDEKRVTEIPVIRTILSKFSLIVIGICGFGFTDSSWVSPPGARPDQAMSMQEAVENVLAYDIYSPLIPNWAYKLPVKWIQKYGHGRARLIQFMNEQCESRKEGEYDDHTAFSMLIRANLDVESKYALSTEELIGNVFIFLLAGHETTAVTLTSTLTLLSLYPKIQDELYEEIDETLVNRRSLESMDDYQKLVRVRSAFLEALRMFSPGHLLWREVMEDTVLTVPPPLGSSEAAKTVPIAKGTRINIDLTGIQYNPRYFPDPHEFKPSRWFSTSLDSETITAFGYGPRICIGRKFALVEAVTFLALFLRDFKVSPLLKEGESLQDWQKKVLDGVTRVTLCVQDAPLLLTKRL